MIKRITKNYHFFLVVIVILLSFSVSCQKSTKVLDEFFDHLEVKTTIDSDIILLDEYHFNNKVINVKWTSTNEDVLSSKGVVKLGDYSVNVTLIAKATYKNETKTKVYNVTVIKDSTASILNAATSKIFLPEYVTTNLSLPKTINSNGKTIEINWESSHPEIISNEGLVTGGISDTEVTLTATFILNNQSVKKSFLITVPKGEIYMDGTNYLNASVYLDEVKGAKYPERQKEFAGAVYHKVISSSDKWLGIETLVTLPEFIPDTGRMGPHPSGLAGDMRYFDNASVYLGGHAANASDVGLAWMIGAKDASCISVGYDKSIAYRPFWRYITKEGKNVYENSRWAETMYYYYPGDTVRMSVFITNENKMRLRIELVKETTIKEYVERRASYMLGDNYSKVFLSPEFEVYGAGVYNSAFKRVCALDQVANEGKPTQPTNAISKNTIWHEVYLYREIDGILRKVPMTSRYCDAMSAPVGKNVLGDFTNAIQISYDGVDKSLGAEVVTIAPNNRK